VEHSPEVAPQGVIVDRLGRRNGLDVLELRLRRQHHVVPVLLEHGLGHALELVLDLLDVKLHRLDGLEQDGLVVRDIVRGLDDELVKLVGYRELGRAVWAVVDGWRDARKYGYWLALRAWVLRGKTVRHAVTAGIGRDDAKVLRMC